MRDGIERQGAEQGAAGLCDVPGDAGEQDRPGREHADHPLGDDERLGGWTLACGRSGRGMVRDPHPRLGQGRAHPVAWADLVGILPFVPPVGDERGTASVAPSFDTTRSGDILRVCYRRLCPASRLPPSDRLRRAIPDSRWNGAPDAVFCRGQPRPFHEPRSVPGRRGDAGNRKRSGWACLWNWRSRWFNPWDH